jgi:hypothetical protein
MAYTELKTGQANPWWKSRWWARVRSIPITKEASGFTAAAEFYVPWWAWPLELTYKALFGATKLG